MSTTGIIIEHEDIVEELNAARMSFWRADVPQGAFVHRVSPLGNTHGILPHERQMAEASYAAVAAIDVERLKAAAQRAADEIIKLREWCSAAAHDYQRMHDFIASADAFVGTSIEGVFASTLRELSESSEFMKNAAQGFADGQLYDDELTKCRDEIKILRRHRDDLLEANNRYLERAWAAEAEIRRRDEKTEDTRQRVQQILRDKVTSSSDLAETIGALGKFIDMIEARAMAVDGPVTPFCEELHAASDLEKSQFQAILSKLYQFRNASVKKPPLVTPEWAQEKAALEDGLDPTTGAATAEDIEVDVSFTRYMDRAYEAMGRAFKVLGLPKPSMFISACKISEITHSFDSLDFIEMLIEVEKTSGFLIDETELPGANLCNIGDIALVLAEKMAKAEGKTKAAGRIKQLAEKIALGGRS